MLNTNFFHFLFSFAILIDYLIKNNYLGYKFQNYYNRIIKMPIFIILFLIIFILLTLLNYFFDISFIFLNR